MSRKCHLALIGYPRPFVLTPSHLSDEYFQISNPELIERGLSEFDDQVSKLVDKFYNLVRNYAGFDWSILDSEYQCYETQFQKKFLRVTTEKMAQIVPVNLFEFYQNTQTSSAYNRYCIAEKKSKGENFTDELLVLISEVLKLKKLEHLGEISHTCEFSDTEIVNMKSVCFNLYYNIFVWYLSNCE